MDYLWSSWRSNYIEGPKPQGCVFCSILKENNDEKNYLLYRGKKNFVIMNLYPYNPGHLMVIPYNHLPAVEQMEDEERIEHYQIVADTIAILKEVIKPHGFNLGMNLGKVSGAGVENHIHTHIVPRWEGDTNFMPVIANTKVVSSAMKDTYNKLKPAFDRLAERLK